MSKDLIIGIICLSLGLIGLQIYGLPEGPPPQKPGEPYKSYRQRAFEHLWLGRD